MPNLFRVEPPANPSPNADNIIANTKLLKETVGWTNKNIITEKHIGYAVFGTMAGAYINTETNGVTYIASVENDTDYTVSKKGGVGDSFIIAGFENQPTIPNTSPETNSEVLVNDDNLYEFTFNSDDYNYIAITVNKTTGTPSTIDTQVEAMIRKADILDSSYDTPANQNGTVKGFIQNINNTIKTAVLNIFYPIGTIYETLNNDFNPNTTWGGTWSKLQNVFLYGSGEYSVGNTGGEKNHTLTIDEIPSHTHNYLKSGVKQAQEPCLPEWYSGDDLGLILDDASIATQPTGGSQAHNNMPPYIVVNIWRRTA